MKPLTLTRGNWSLCEGCANARHTAHDPTNCLCDLCTEPMDPAGGTE